MMERYISTTINAIAKRKTKMGTTNNFQRTKKMADRQKKV